MAHEKAMEVQKTDPALWEVYKLNYECHKEGITMEDMAQSYNKWGEGYEQTMTPRMYKGWLIVARELEGLFPESRGQVRIFDIGAGTGLLGLELYRLGFRDMDALDPAQALLDICKKKGVYKKMICDFIDDRQLPIKQGSYDCVAVAGAMGEGHIPCAALHEMARLTKSGGYVVIVMMEEYLDYVLEYKDRLEPMMRDMELAGTWRQTCRKIVPDYAFNNNGVVYVFRVC